MLLINDDETEIRELHVLLQQGVRADDDAGRATRNFEQVRTTRCRTL